MRLENAKAKMATVMKCMPASPRPLCMAACTSDMFVSRLLVSMAASPSAVSPCAAPQKIWSVLPMTKNISMPADAVQMTIVSIKTEKVCTRPCLTGWLTEAEAAALGAEPMPASLENRPRLMPWTTIEPAKPPTTLLKLKASEKIMAKTAGS